MRRRRNNRYVEVALLFFSVLLLGAKKEDHAQILRPEDKIPNLEFESEELNVELDDNGPLERPYVMLGGRFKARDGTLTISSQGNKPIQLDKGDRFKFRVYLRDKETQFKLAEVDALGKVRYEALQVHFEGWQNFREDLELDFKREFVFIPSVGITSANYTETRPDAVLRYSGTLITPKFTINYRYAPRWTLGVNAFYSAAALSSSIPGFVLRFLGINGRIGYQLSSVRDPWNLSLGMGMYFVTTQPSIPETMGFTNAMGPQFTSNLKYRYSQRDSLTLFFKFAPVGERMYLRSLSDREIAMGLGVSRSYADGKHIGSITLDWADFKILISDEASGVTVQTSNSSLSLSVSYTL